MDDPATSSSRVTEFCKNKTTLGAGNAVMAILLKTVSPLPEAQNIKPVKPIFSEEECEALVGSCVILEEAFIWKVLLLAIS